jgi:tRNA nucleotidyltransferase (CCA-adding enzyme)
MLQLQSEKLSKIPLYKAGFQITKIFAENNFQAFWVGGIVRNLLLNRDSDNIDIATDATPDQIEKILNKAKIINKPVGKKFGSILAIVKGFKIEITTFRSEGRYSDNRHPDQVQFIGDFLDDAKRRDFTINALYFDPIKKQLYDPTNGQRDQQAKLLRFVGDPKKRIDEDALRMLRGVRLATQIGFKLEKNSFAAIKTRAKYIQGISGERVKAELDKILSSPNRVAGIELLDKIGLLRFIVPEFEALKKFSHKSKLYHLEGSQFDHTLFALSKAQSLDTDLAYAILFHDIGKPQVAKPRLKDEGWVISTHGHEKASADIFKVFSRKYRFSSASAKKIHWAVENHMMIPKFYEMRDEKKVKYASLSNFDFLLQLGIADDLGNKRDVKIAKIHKPGWKEAKRIYTKLLNLKDVLDRLARGDLIMKYSKLKPGVELGRKIEKVKAQIVLGKIKTEKDLKKYLIY